MNVIDLHSHILPAVDDGAADVAVSVEMARVARREGIVAMACTPHFYSGVYDNVGQDILHKIDRLAAAFEREQIDLKLYAGGDVRMDAGLVEALRRGDVLTLNGTRYVLIEPPHHSYAPQLDQVFSDLLMAGYVPILTHPERLSWIETKFDVIERCFANGVLMQLTAGSITGDFGRRVAAWAHRMLRDGMVHIVATDAHDPVRRPPRMRQCIDMLSTLVGEAEAARLVSGRPRQILADVDPAELDSIRPIQSAEPRPPKSLWSRIVSAR